MNASVHELAIGSLVVHGGTIPDVRLAAHVWGDPSRGTDAGWDVVIHALTGSADIAAWWGPLLGPGRALDPTVRPVVAVNLLGSCYGSTGPTAWRGDPSRFPSITPVDQARALLRGLDVLGVTRIVRGIGGSLGGMVALEVGQRSAIPIEHLVVLAAPARATARAIGWSAAQRIALDAAGARTADGLAAARAVAMLTYRGASGLERRFGNRRDPDGRFAIEAWLAHHGSALVARFDADTYRTLLHALDTHDLGDLAEAGEATARQVTRITGVGISSDVLYPPGTVRRWVRAYRAAGAQARYRELRSVHGHDAFLIETGAVGEVLTEEM
ncbi:MAG TPA: alpha/beta fold hydrolase [Gemmatimonadales bacterium]|nr:alpha/beta fold hydrolase [Gemmatimonadales bacterium]